MSDFRPTLADNWVRAVLMIGFVAVFGVLVWQLYNLTPLAYCSSVFNAAAKAGDKSQGAEYYVACVVKLLDTKTIVLGGCLAIIGVFVIAHVVRETKVAASFTGPGGFGGTIGSAADGAAQVAEAATDKATEIGEAEAKP